MYRDSYECGTFRFRKTLHGVVAFSARVWTTLYWETTALFPLSRSSHLFPLIQPSSSQPHIPTRDTIVNWQKTHQHLEVFLVLYSWDKKKHQKFNQAKFFTMKTVFLFELFYMRFAMKVYSQFKTSIKFSVFWSPNMTHLRRKIFPFSLAGHYKTNPWLAVRTGHKGLGTTSVVRWSVDKRNSAYFSFWKCQL
jgi:hypothetical protein